MNCKETQKYIDDFIKDKLDEEVIDEFIDHISSCKECKEELQIQYLVTEGIQRLEKSATLDIQRELEEKIEQTKAKRIFQKRMNRCLWGMGIFLVIILAAILVNVIFA